MRGVKEPQKKAALAEISLISVVSPIINLSKNTIASVGMLLKKKYKSISWKHVKISKLFLCRMPHFTSINQILLYHKSCCAFCPSRSCSCYIHVGGTQGKLLWCVTLHPSKHMINSLYPWCAENTVFISCHHPTPSLSFPCFCANTHYIRYDPQFDKQRAAPSMHRLAQKHSGHVISVSTGLVHHFNS